MCYVPVREVGTLDFHDFSSLSDSAYSDNIVMIQRNKLYTEIGFVRRPFYNAHDVVIKVITHTNHRHSVAVVGDIRFHY